jgi:hypothetical protein
MKPGKNMAFEMEIVWSAKARITFFKVLDYLQQHWTRKEIVQFSQRTEIVIRAIRKNHGIFPISSKNKEIRKAIVDKNNSFFYSVDVPNNKIYLLTFYDNRQDPEKLIID